MALATVSHCTNVANAKTADPKIQRFLVTSTSTPNNNINIPAMIAGASQTGSFFLRLVRIFGATLALEAVGLERVMITDDTDALGLSGTVEVSIANGDISGLSSCAETGSATAISSLRV